MVVNCDYRKDRTLHADAPFAMERFDPVAGTWSSVGACRHGRRQRGDGEVRSVQRQSAQTGFATGVGG